MLGDIFWLGRLEYDFYSIDAAPLWFGKSVAWITEPLPPLGHLAGYHVAHLPAIWHNQIGALYLAITGLPADSLLGFRQFGFFINSVVIFLTSLWGAYLARLIKADYIAILAISTLAAMEPGARYVFTSYYWMAAFIPVVALGVVAWLKGYWNNLWVSSTTILLGLMLALQYATVVMAAALLCAFLFIYDRQKTWPIFRQLAEDNSGKFFFVPFMVIGSTFILGFVLIITDAIGVFSQLALGYLGELRSWRRLFYGVIAVFGLLGLVPVFLIAKRIPQSPFWNGTSALGGRIFLGWGLGVNVLALDTWQNGLIYLLNLKLGGYNWGNIYRIILANPWHLLIPLTIIGGIFLLFRTKEEGVSTTRFAAVFVISAFILNIRVILGINLSDTTSEFQIIYTIGRYFMSSLLGFSLVILVMPFNPSRIFAGLGIMLFLWSFQDYSQRWPPQIKALFKINQEADQLVKDFLSQNPEGKVLCESSFMPTSCQLRYAYNFAKPGQFFLPEGHNIDKRIIYSTTSCQKMADCQQPYPVLLMSSRGIKEELKKNAIAYGRWDGVLPWHTLVPLEYLIIPPKP